MGVQLTAIVRNEIRMQWRRGNLRMLLFAFTAIPVLMSAALTMPSDSLLAEIQLRVLSADQTREVWTASAILNTVFLVPLLSCIVTVVAAETIAIDRHYGVGEVIGSLPVTSSVYVTGKLLSVWLPLVALLALSVAVIGSVVWIRQGAFNIGTFAAYGLASVLPSALFMSGVSVLWPARQPTRRRATLFGFLLVCVNVVVFVALMMDYFVGAMNVLANTTKIDARAAFPSVTSLDYVIRLLAMSGVLVVSWWFARAKVRE